MPGIEPGTSSLPRKRSTPELHRLTQGLERETRLELATPTLEGLCSTNWAIPACWLPGVKQWGEKDSNLRSRATVDLQSTPVGHFGISPVINMLMNSLLHQSRWRDSNPRPADYKSAALTNWATSAIKERQWNTPSKIGSQMYEYFAYITKKYLSFLNGIKKAAEAAFLTVFYVLFLPDFLFSFHQLFS